jgi:tRNA-dihydrouridine synthase
MAECTRIATGANPDLIDINYGCPVKKVACRGAGAALLQNVPLMTKMTEEVVKATHLPVTVKTRLGWDESTKNIEEVAERLQDVGIQALSIHGRTRAQLYKGEADWTLIAKVKNNPRIKIPIFGAILVNSANSHFTTSPGSGFVSIHIVVNINLHYIVLHTR